MHIQFNFNFEGKDKQDISVYEYLEKYNHEKYIEFLNDEINKTKEKLDLLECMTLEDIDNEVLESCKKYEKK